MRGRPYYRSRLLLNLAGLSLLVLGAGNALIGRQKLAQYQEIVAEGHARGYLPETGATDRILRPLDEEGERYNIGRAKVDLYFVVTNGGLLMMGIVLVLFHRVRQGSGFRRVLGSEGFGAEPRDSGTSQNLGTPNPGEPNGTLWNLAEPSGTLWNLASPRNPVEPL